MQPTCSLHVDSVSIKSTHFGFWNFCTILILTFYKAGTVTLAITQAFKAHWEMKIKQMATLLNIGLIITNIYYFIQNSLLTCLMFVPISIWCHSFNLGHLMHDMIAKCLHVAPMYNSAASPAILLS
jgi:hypothetical protein